MGKRIKSNVHDCDLPVNYEVIMPGLPPNAPVLRRLQRLLFKVILVSDKNIRARQNLRSSAAFIQDKRRHVRSKCWYLIHPYSRFRTSWERFMAIILTVSLMMIPFMATFMMAVEHNKYVNEEVETKTYYAASTLDFICLIDVAINFISGYVKDLTNEIIMNQKLIIRHYMVGFFFIDFVSSFPTDLVRILLVHHYSVLPPTKVMNMICLASAVLKIFRIKTLIKYLSQFAQLRGFQGHGLRILKTVVIVVLYIHWMTCTHYLVPLVVYYDVPVKDISSKSWTKHSKMFSKDPWSQYTSSFSRTISNLCSVGYGHLEPESTEDIIVSCINQLSGFIILAYLIVIILQRQQSHNAPVTKYLQLMNQLQYYMVYRQLPKHLQLRLTAYYEHGYHRRYFREQAIMDNLSETLRQEINMHMCRKLIKNVLIFRGQPPSVISNIIKYLKLKVYLTNDEIIRAGTPGDCMYFVSTGTVAVMSPGGKEISHMEDGAFVGEVTMVTEEKIHIASIIAASICELYRLDQKDFVVCIQPYESLLERITSIAYDRKAEIQMVDRADYDN